jgi:nondiscriminating glutamyl-tRNA synthetase
VIKFNQMLQVRVRMAPTPSGLLHLGTAHTALFNWLFARHHRGKFILRIDDTDPKRYKKEYEGDILKNLRWLGFTWDEGPDIGGPYEPYRQSERMGRYWKYVERLLQGGKAYYCYCSPEELEAERKGMLAKGIAPKYSGKCRNLTKEQVKKFKKENRKAAVRLKVNPGEVSFVDPSRGKITVWAEDIGDFIIARGDKTALLVTAATVDDLEMKITHTIRGEDYINFVPRQILLYQALGEKPPVFAHLPFIYGPDGTKLSKRHGAVAVSDYRKQGYLPEALVNYLVLLGWSPKDDREILDIEEVIRLFDLKDVRDAGPRFDFEKLNWLNGQYVRKLSTKDLAERLKSFIPRGWPLDLVRKIIPLEQERIVKLADFAKLADFFFKDRLDFDRKLLIQEGKTREETREVLEGAWGQLKETAKWQAKSLEFLMRSFAKGRDWTTKDLFMTLRIIITGKTATPPLFETMEILGRNKTVERIKEAIKKLK